VSSFGPYDVLWASGDRKFNFNFTFAVNSYWRQECYEHAVVPIVGFTALVGVTRNFDTVDHMMAIVLQMLYEHVPTLFRFFIAIVATCN